MFGKGAVKTKHQKTWPPLDGFEIIDASQDVTPRKEVTGRVKPWQCQVAVAVVQVVFVVGALLVKVGFKAAVGPFNPLFFAFLREAAAGPILCVIAYLYTGVLPQRKDLMHIAGLGVCLYANQAFYILGISWSGVVVATCMQPAIPVFTAMLGVLLQLETGSLQKFLGILLAVAGSISMVLGGVSVSAHEHPGSSSAASDMLQGNVALLANTVAMAAYYILAKQLVAKYNPVNVAAWAYMMAAACMGLTVVVTVERTQWTLPTALVGPLLYWIIIASICGYYALTFAIAHLPASQVAAFQCLQPFLGTVLGILFMNEHVTWWHLGALAIIGGLLLVSTSQDTPELH